MNINQTAGKWYIRCTFPCFVYFTPLFTPLLVWQLLQEIDLVMLETRVTWKIAITFCMQVLFASVHVIIAFVICTTIGSMESESEQQGLKVEMLEWISIIVLPVVLTALIAVVCALGIWCKRRRYKAGTYIIICALPCKLSKRIFIYLCSQSSQLAMPYYFSYRHFMITCVSVCEVRKNPEYSYLKCPTLVCLWQLQQMPK